MLHGHAWIGSLDVYRSDGRGTRTMGGTGETDCTCLPEAAEELGLILNRLWSLY
jgi:hypothetical protein